MSAQPTDGAATGTPRRKTTVLTLAEKRQKGEAITMVTAYDYPTARAVDQAGVDAILVGDSLAMVVLGHPNTLSVTMDEMLHHARAVARGAKGALLVGDMPFLSYQADPSDAVRNAGHYLQVGMDAVKMEGGRTFASTAAALVRAGIPVQGHVGLTPQSVNALGGFKVQGKTAEAARTLLEDALALEDAGCFSIVLESIPARLATHITERLTVPTIGIGAGPGTTGQVLVLHDMLGLYERSPKFAKRYADLGTAIVDAVRAFKGDVDAHAFPAPENSFVMDDAEWQAFLDSLRPAPAVGPRPVRRRA
jgi:3-methyl-2-oxobutanoate hydroxymethyltransferase